MRKYALQRVGTLLRRLAFRVNRAAKLHDPESTHDLRVAIRRFQQSLEVFQQFLPRGQTKKIRRRLRQIMRLTGAIRNRDIALDLLIEADRAEESVISLWRQEKQQFQAELDQLLGRLSRRDFSAKWDARLGL